MARMWVTSSLSPRRVAGRDPIRSRLISSSGVAARQNSINPGVSYTRPAIGAAIAVSLGVGGVAITHAVVTSGERDVFVPISPCRLFDYRPAPDQVGPRGTALQPGETYTQAVRGANGNCNIPADATAISMNVTAVGGTVGSFLTIWPSDVAPRPLASNLNWVPGSPPTPNKVDVKVSVADGKINLFNLTGTVFVLADVVGYYADHNFDDRYYTKAAIDSTLSSEITMTNHSMWTANAFVPPTNIQYSSRSTRVNGGNGFVEVSIAGPKSINGVAYGLKSVTYCFDGRVAPAFVTASQVISEPGIVLTTDPTDHTADGCYTVAVNHGSSVSYYLGLTMAGAGGSIDVYSVTSVWAPAALLPASNETPAQPGPDTGHRTSR